MDSFSEIIQEVLTLDQSRELVGQLNEVVAHLYTTPQNAGDIYQNLPLPIKSAIVASLEKEQRNGDSAKVEEYLKKVITQIEELPSIKLTLVFSPSEKYIKDIVDWLYKNTGRHMLVDIEVDPSIIAGAKIQYQGVYKNYSLTSLGG